MKVTNTSDSACARAHVVRVVILVVSHLHDSIRALRGRHSSCHFSHLQRKFITAQLSHFTSGESRKRIYTSTDINQGPFQKIDRPILGLIPRLSKVSQDQII